MSVQVGLGKCSLTSYFSPAPRLVSLSIEPPWAMFPGDTGRSASIARSAALTLPVSWLNSIGLYWHERRALVRRKDRAPSEAHPRSWRQRIHRRECCSDAPSLSRRRIRDGDKIARLVAGKDPPKSSKGS